MLFSDFTQEMLGMQDVKVKKVVQKETEVEICFEMRKKEQVCPCCGAKTNAVHDYRIQRVKDLSCFGKRVEILFQKRRYRCKACQKRFYEKNTVVGRYQRRTKRLTAYILRQQDAITKLKFLKEMLTVIEILPVFATVFCICFLISKTH